MTDNIIQYWAHMLDEAFCKDIANEAESNNNRSASAARRMAKAKKDKYDEFYTSYADTAKLLLPFKKHLRGKKVLMPCDNPNKSEMFKWVFDNFSSLGLASLSCVGYGCTDMLVMDSPDNFDMVPVYNNGDFTKGESLEALDTCDVVIGNPPFSQKLGVQFLIQPLQHGKDVIGIETPEKCTYGDLKDAIVSRALTVYTCPYTNFNVPIDQMSGERSTTDTGVYENGEVQVYAFSSFSGVNELKSKLDPLFKKAASLGVRYDDLPDSPSGPRADRIDIKVLYDYDTQSHTNFTWIPPKPKSDGISNPKLAISCYKILGYNWERYFNLEDRGVVRIKGTLVNPRTGEKLQTRDAKGNLTTKDINTNYFIFLYK